GGVIWSPLVQGMPRVPVVSLALNAPSRLLRAATAGRGMWDLHLVPVTPTVNVAPATVAFDDQVIGSASQARPITLSNGIWALDIKSISTSGDFEQTNNCDIGRMPGSYCVISVTFKPSSQGVINGELTIVDSATDSPQKVSLS